MALDPKKIYRYETRAGFGIGIVADWVCTICGKVIYPETHIADVPNQERKDGCRRCVRILDLAYETAVAWWERYRTSYRSETFGSDGVYGLRDDLVLHLARGITSPALARYVKRNRLEFPS